MSLGNSNFLAACLDTTSSLDLTLRWRSFSHHHSEVTLALSELHRNILADDKDLGACRMSASQPGSDSGEEHGAMSVRLAQNLLGHLLTFVNELFGTRWYLVPH